MGPAGLGVLHTSGKATVTPLLSLVTTDILFTPTVLAISPLRTLENTRILFHSTEPRAPNKSLCGRKLGKERELSDTTKEVRPHWHEVPRAAWRWVRWTCPQTRLFF